LISPRVAPAKCRLFSQIGWKLFDVDFTLSLVIFAC
jgi:hypothetical protein